MRKLTTILVLALTCGCADVTSDVAPTNERAIVGGRPAPVDAYPWMVAIFSRTDEATAEWNQICGGMLMDATHVVTAAHCFVSHRELEATNQREFFVQPTRLRAVVHRPRSIAALTPSDYQAPKRVVVHPHYDPQTQANDLAVVELASPITLARYPQLAPASVRTAVEGQRSVRVIGYGRNWAHQASDFLQEVDLPVVSRDTCAKAMAPAVITPEMLCAGDGDGKLDSCQGDSGGPLFVPGEGNRPETLLGVVSFGRGCGEPNSYGVYASVTSAMGWLTTCLAGACESLRTVTTCAENFGDCNGESADGCEVMLLDNTACGACNVVCPEKHVCSSTNGPPTCVDMSWW